MSVPCAITLPTYLTVQIQEIITYGVHHYLTWAKREEWQLWLQISVHESTHYQLCIQFPLPSHCSQSTLDRIFQQRGWAQVGLSQSLTYYLASSTNIEELSARAERIAQQCALAMQYLWGVQGVEELLLLGARGPNLPLPKREKVLKVA
jgi:hypothetical protein